MAPASLLSLPPDLIEYICHLVFLSKCDKDPKECLQLLSSLSRTCKQVHYAAAPALYRRFTLPSSKSMPACLNFLTSLCRRPELGKYVQELSFDFCSAADVPATRCPILFEAAARLGVDLGPQPRQHTFEMLAQLIIAHSPNVKSIDFSADQFIRRPTSVPRVLDQLAQKRQMLFGKLEDLTVKHLYTPSFSIEHYAGLIMLSPRLRQLVVEPSSPLEYPWRNPNDNNLPYLSSVRKLTLNLGSLNRDQMRRIVHACGPLELFHHFNSRLNFERRRSVTPAEMVCILGRHVHTLGELKLDLSWRHKDNLSAFFATPLCFEGEQIQSLRAFSSLRTLQLDGSCFLFPERNDEDYHENVFMQLLPKSIQSFCITVALPGTVENLRTVAMWRSQFPHLMEVNIGNEVHCAKMMQNVFFIWQDVTALGRMMRKLGIEFNQSCSLIGIPPTPSPSITDATPPESGSYSSGGETTSQLLHHEASSSGSEDGGGDASDAGAPGAVEPDVEVSHVEGPGANGSGADEPHADEPHADGPNADAALQQASTGLLDEEDLYD
ncbi:hypothetical protein TgHK011_006885 [Trichoderma gracile]|nr:hypothetical protein TgHK011_006885 [Trichoderma gracile]